MYYCLLSISVPNLYIACNYLFRSVIEAYEQIMKIMEIIIIFSLNLIIRNKNIMR